MNHSNTHDPRGWGAAIVIAMALVFTPLLAEAGKPALSAGIGLENRTAHPDYPLKLVFATRAGAYLADVSVQVFDTSGKRVTQAQSAGPWLYLDVPAGEYRVVATSKTHASASARVNVTGTEQIVVNLTWQAKP